MSESENSGDRLSPKNHPWEKIYRREGNVFPEPFPRFPEVLALFKEAGCNRLLDLGCGTGRHTVHLARAGFSVTGLDISITGLRYAVNWLAENKVAHSLVQANLNYPMPFSTAAFDGLLSTQVIHHALRSQVEATIDEIWRVLKPGGIAFVTVAARLHDDETYDQVEAGTFIPRNGPEAGLPHHIFDEGELHAAFGRFQMREVSLRAEGRVLAMLAIKE